MSAECELRNSESQSKTENRGIDGDVERHTMTNDNRPGESALVLLTLILR